GSDSFLVHWEGNLKLHRTVQSIRALAKRSGIAINPATRADVLEEILPDVDQVLVMTITPGFGHQHFLHSTLAGCGKNPGQTNLSTACIRIVLIPHSRLGTDPSVPGFFRSLLGKIHRVRRLIDRVKPACDLEVDGGIDPETARLCVEAGASVLAPDRLFL